MLLPADEEYKIECCDNVGISILFLDVLMHVNVFKSVYKHGLGIFIPLSYGSLVEEGLIKCSSSNESIFRDGFSLGYQAILFT